MRRGVLCNAGEASERCPTFCNRGVLLLPVPLGDDDWNKTVIKMVARMVVMVRSDQRQVMSNMRIQQIWVCACGLAQDQRE